MCKAGGALDGGGKARYRMAGLGLVSSALSAEGHALLAAAVHWCTGGGTPATSLAGAAGAGMLAVLARQGRWQAATLMSLDKVLAVAGAELRTEYKIALSKLSATPPPPPPPPPPPLTTTTSLEGCAGCACSLCGMSGMSAAEGQGSSRTCDCNSSGFSSSLDEAAEPSEAQLFAARREYIARALDPWRDTGVTAAEVRRASLARCFAYPPACSPVLPSQPLY